MPNWVSIKLNVKAQTPEELQSFLADVDVRNDEAQECAEDFNSFEFNFNALIPQPENLYRKNISSKDQERLAKEGIPNWYDWNIKNWGTKWNACGSNLNKLSDTECIIYFDTAWSFPDPVIAAMYDKYPNLEFNIIATEESHAFALEMDSEGNVDDLEYTYFSDGKGEVFWNADKQEWEFADDSVAENGFDEVRLYNPRRDIEVTF